MGRFPRAFNCRKYAGSENTNRYTFLFIISWQFIGSTRCPTSTCWTKCKRSIFHLSHHIITIHLFLYTILTDHCRSLIVECERNYELLPANITLHLNPAPVLRRQLMVRQYDPGRNDRGGSECSSAGCHHTEERLHTLQWCVCAHVGEERAATAGSDRFWSSGCQNRPPRRVRPRWAPAPVGRTAGLLMCWCTTGTSHCHQTPERHKYHI